MKKELTLTQIKYIYDVYQLIGKDEATATQINDAYFLIDKNPADELGRTTTILKWMNTDYIFELLHAQEREIERTRKQRDESERILNKTLKGIR